MCDALFRWQRIHGMKSCVEFGSPLIFLGEFLLVMVCGWSFACCFCTCFASKVCCCSR